MNVTVNLTEPTFNYSIHELNNYLEQSYYDEIFDTVIKSESDGQNDLPLNLESVNKLWALIKTKLVLMEKVKVISNDLDFSTCTICLSSKVNYFLAEDLNKLAQLDDTTIVDSTSLGAWSSDEDMNIQEQISDNGSMEIFFPFDYDKYQLNVLGIVNNKSAIVEGPPGTGKSQTITNILCHLAATGKKVLFASQKDQAIRGVKDRLKGLNIPFLFGYIPDKSSSLYTEEDEKDSAANALKNLQHNYRFKPTNNQKEPLSIINEKTFDFNINLENGRKLYHLLEDIRQYDYIKLYAEVDINKDWWQEYENNYHRYVELAKVVGIYQDKNSDVIQNENKLLENVHFNDSKIISFIEKITSEFKSSIPERSNRISKAWHNNQLNHTLKKYGKTIVEEIYKQVEGIVFSDETKSKRIKCLDDLRKYFEYRQNKQELETLNSSIHITLNRAKVTPEQAQTLLNLTMEHGTEKIFKDIEKYRALKVKINNTPYTSINDLNAEIKKLKKY